MGISSTTPDTVADMAVARDNPATSMESVSTRHSTRFTTMEITPEISGVLPSCSA